MHLTDQEFHQFSEYIRAHYGINLTESKRALLSGRLALTIQQQGFDSYQAYFDHVRQDQSGRGVKELLNKVTTNHTYFYRERAHYDFFEHQVLPWVKASEQTRRDLRVWSAGCSSGDEAFTLSMLIYEALGNERGFWNTQVLATDISEQALENAREAVYDDEQIRQLPKLWQQKYFQRLGADQVKVAKDLRENVIFRRFNLMHPFPFRRRFHTIFCRNVMIYFDRQTKLQLVHRFYDILEEGGYLFIGHSESLERGTTPFSYVQPAIYRKES